MSMTNKFPLLFIGLLFLLTVIILNRYFEAGMMGLTVFSLAYLTKGMRRSKSHH